MISYGFEKLEEFYSTSSTRSLVGRLKIPVLFIEVCVLSLTLQQYGIT